MLYFHAVRGADAGTKINNPRGAVRTRQNIPKPHRVRAVRGAVDISNTHKTAKYESETLGCRLRIGFSNQSGFGSFITVL